MKFECSVTINKPIDEVVKMFVNTDNLKEWQNGFQKYERLSGAVGQQGAKTLLVYKNGKNIIDLTETILVSNLPAEFKGIYENKHMSNTMTSRFTASSPTQTKYEATIDDAKFHGFMPKLMSIFMSGMMKNKPKNGWTILKPLPKKINENTDLWRWRYRQCICI